CIDRRVGSLYVALRLRIGRGVCSRFQMTFLRAFVASVLLVVLAACSAEGEGRDDQMNVVTTFTVIADIARNVAGDAATVESITKPNAEIHNYQPTPGDLIKAQKADLILWNGLNLELWFEKFFANLDEVPGVVVSEEVEPMGIAEGPYTGKPNPHAW